MQQETWRTIPHYPNYEISESGRVRRLTQGGRRYPPGYELTAKSHPRGYLCYSLAQDGKERTELAHRLVLFAFKGDPPTDRHEAAHNDGTRTNNHISNLRWALPAENQADRKRHGTDLRGETTPTSKLKTQQVATIKLRASFGEKQADLAREYGVGDAQISRIVNDKQWLHV